ncbi:hypothetical protein [Pedobacter sp. SYP-B3415]|uniref:hypothetical protein n=1 Tax=Pedobacter sp. SYP-B3415 TaxID=2496641 RepID=UPI00101DFE15|nr:hypothetical protein [Pedobacter sp. SYP-B3415]
MYISDIVKELSAAAGLTFYHGPKDYQNIQDQSSATILPVCYLSMPIRSRRTRTRAGFGTPSYYIEVLFADASQLQWETDEHLQVIKNMETVADRFLNSLLNHPAVKDVSEHEFIEVINLFDMNLSGIIANITVQINDIRPNCP